MSHDGCQFRYGGRNVCGATREAHEGDGRYILTHGYVDNVSRPDKDEASRSIRRVQAVIEKRSEAKTRFATAWQALMALAKNQQHPPGKGRCACGATTGGPTGTQACYALAHLANAAGYICRKEAKTTQTRIRRHP